MPNGGFYGVFLAQEALDRARLGGRFDDHQAASGGASLLIFGGTFFAAFFGLGRFLGFLHDFRFGQGVVSRGAAHPEQAGATDFARPTRARCAGLGIDGFRVAERAFGFAFYAVGLQYFFSHRELVLVLANLQI